MLKVNMWAYHFHEIYSQTDFMRFFLDDVYQIVQKLFLPTRTAEILARLAEVDLICEKAADCQEKVSKLKCIFTSLLSKPNKASFVLLENKFYKIVVYLIFPCLFSFQASELQLSPISTPEEYTKKTLRSISPARFLEKPNDLSQMSDTSPIHYHLNNVKYSNQVKHKTKCKCRLCQNLLIQILTMNTLTLEAEIFNLENNVKNAMTCYSEAYKIFSKLEHLRGEKSELICLEVVDTLKSHSEYLDFMVRPVQFYSTRFLLNYSLFESTISNTITDSMKNSMEIISKLMRKFSYEQKLLMWKFVELKLLRVVIAKEKEIKRKGE